MTLFFAGSMASLEHMPRNGRGHFHEHHVKNAAQRPGWTMLNSKGTRAARDCLAACIFFRPSEFIGRLQCHVQRLQEVVL